MMLLLTALIIITCVLLVIIVLIQNPKGGGLSSAFGGSGTQLFGGVKKTTDFLDKGTWALSIALVVLVLITNVMVGPSAVEEETPESELTDQPLNNPTPIPAGDGLQGDDELPQPVEGN